MQKGYPGPTTTKYDTVRPLGEILASGHAKDGSLMSVFLRKKKKTCMKARYSRLAFFIVVV
jgi:hypothetical protein